MSSSIQDTYCLATAQQLFSIVSVVSADGNEKHCWLSHYAWAHRRQYDCIKHLWNSIEMCLRCKILWVQHDQTSSSCWTSSAQSCTCVTWNFTIISESWLTSMWYQNRAYMRIPYLSLVSARIEALACEKGVVELKDSKLSPEHYAGHRLYTEWHNILSSVSLW